MTTSLVPALMTTPFWPLFRMPAMEPPLPSMTRALVMVTAPKPPGSRTLISPLAAVLEMAPAKVLQGAVRLHGLASSPTPETQVRVAWAWREEAPVKRTPANREARKAGAIFMIGSGREGWRFEARLIPCVGGWEHGIYPSNKRDGPNFFY